MSNEQGTDKAVAAEGMTTETRPSPEAQAFIDKLIFSFDQFGLESTLLSFPKMEQMLGAIAHCVANNKMAPEYKQPLTQISMYLFTQIKVREMIASQMGKDPSEVNIAPVAVVPGQAQPELSVSYQHQQGVMSENITQPWCEACQSHHPVTTQSAHGISVGCITELNSKYKQCMMQLFVGEPHNSEGLHAFLSASEVDMLIEKLTIIRKELAGRSN